jgi:pyridoxamine 5'-phosphate oxidase family protein
MIFTDAELEYLAAQPLGRLATLGPSGVLQNNPVGFSVNTQAGTIDIGGWNMAASRKFRNVRDNGQVSFVIDDLQSRDPWTVRGIEVRGTAEALGGRPAPGGQAGKPAAGQPAEDEIIRIHPATIFSWGIEPGRPAMTRRTAG